MEYIDIYIYRYASRVKGLGLKGSGFRMQGSRVSGFKVQGGLPFPEKSTTPLEFNVSEAHTAQD